MRQKTKTGKICHISGHAKSNSTEWGGVRLYLEDGKSIHEAEAPKTTLSRSEPVRASSLRSIV